VTPNFDLYDRDHPYVWGVFDVDANSGGISGMSAGPAKSPPSFWDSLTDHASDCVHRRPRQNCRSFGTRRTTADRAVCAPVGVGGDMSASVRVGLRRIGALDLMVDDRGRDDDAILVIVVGFDQQLGGVECPDEFADALCDRGWRVVRFDHRDIGLSTGFDDQRVDVDAIMAARATGRSVEVPYTLVDMAGDVAGIIGSLEHDAHVRLMGVSMGGIIARWRAVRYPELIDSLVLVMRAFDTQLPKGMPGPDPNVVAQTRPTAVRRSRRDAIEATMETWRSFAGSRFAFDEEWTRRRVTFAYNRSYRPDARSRQYAAVLGSPPVAPHLGSIGARTRIVLGDSDPLVPVAQGIALSERIPGAELRIVPGLGHELPPAAWPQLLELISSPIAP
jgi:pimeloyl-ACP methyl ester carboxylesterase